MDMTVGTPMACCHDHHQQHDPDQQMRSCGFMQHACLCCCIVAGLSAQDTQEPVSGYCGLGCIHCKSSTAACRIGRSRFTFQACRGCQVSRHLGVLLVLLQKQPGWFKYQSNRTGDRKSPFSATVPVTEGTGLHDFIPGPTVLWQQPHMWC